MLKCPASNRFSIQEGRMEKRRHLGILKTVFPLSKKDSDKSLWKIKMDLLANYTRI